MERSAATPLLRARAGRRYRLRLLLGEQVWLAEAGAADTVGADRSLVTLAPIDGEAGEAALRGALWDRQRLAGVSHPGVVAPTDVVTLDGRPATVSPYVAGRDFIDLLSEGLPLSARLELLRHVAGALARCHGVIDRGSEEPAPVVHGGLTSSSVRVTPEGRVRVVGFGRAQGLHTPSDDILALGELIFLALAGEPLGALPSSSWKHNALALQRVLIIEGAPEALLDLLMNCLSWQPERRPVADAVAQALDVHGAALDGPSLRAWCASNAMPAMPAMPPAAPRAAPPEPRRSPPPRQRSELLPAMLPSAPRPAPAPRLDPRLLINSPEPEEPEDDPVTEEAALWSAMSAPGRLSIPRPRLMPRIRRIWRAKLKQTPMPEELPAQLPALTQVARPPQPRHRPLRAALLIGGTLGLGLGLGLGWRAFFTDGVGNIDTNPTVETVETVETVSPIASPPADRVAPVSADLSDSSPAEDRAITAITALLGEDAPAPPQPPVLVRVPDARDVILRCGGAPVFGLSTAYIEAPGHPVCAVDATFGDGDAVGAFSLQELDRVVCQRDGDTLDCVEDD